MVKQFIGWGLAMVKVGFIVEGECEEVLIKSEAFQRFLNQYGFDLRAIDGDEEDLLVVGAGGNTKLFLPAYMQEFIETLQAKGAEEIYVLTDLEDEIHVDAVRSRIGFSSLLTDMFIAVKALEAWFLADTEAMKTWLKTDDFFEEFPEKTVGKPWERLQEIAQEKQASRGKNKVRFTQKMLQQYGFSIERASQHPNCPSARELVEHFRPASHKESA